MPLFDYRVLDKEGNPTNIIIEHFCKAPAPKQISSQNGDVAVLEAVQLIARTSTSWADACETRFGVNGFHNRALGKTFKSEREADRYAEMKGLTRLDDLDKYFVEDNMDRLGQEEEAYQRQIDAYQAQHKSYFENQAWS